MSGGHTYIRNLARELALAGETQLAQWINITLTMGGANAERELAEGLGERLRQCPKIPPHLMQKLRHLSNDPVSSVA